MYLHSIDRRPGEATAVLSSRRWRLASLLVLAAGVVVAGCGRGENIHSYKVAKEASPPAATVASSEPTDRMLAAILPAGDKAWFLKVAGPMADVDAAASKATDFFASVRPADGGQPPEWKLPDGWTEQKGTGMRAATINIPSEGKPLELSVIGLPWSGGPNEVLDNVNRWRGQMNLAPVSVAGLADCTRALKVGGATMTVVDLRGTFKSSGMSAPFAGGGPMMGGPMAGSSGGLPAGHPPIGSSGASLHYTAPDGWQEEPASGMRKASFQIADGDKQAQVAVFDFPDTAGPAIADPLANVNRWRGEVGLGPLEADALSGAVEKLKIGGQEGTYVAIVPDAPADESAGPPRGTLAAMVVDGNRIWFFKLSGDPEVVSSQRDQFRSFLDSVQFGADDGANNGN